MGRYVSPPAQVEVVPDLYKRFHDSAQAEGLEVLRSRVVAGHFGEHTPMGMQYLDFRDRETEAVFAADQRELFRRSVEATETAARAAIGSRNVAIAAVVVAIAALAVAIATYAADHAEKIPSPAVKPIAALSAPAASAPVKK